MQIQAWDTYMHACASTMWNCHVVLSIWPDSFQNYIVYCEEGCLCCPSFRVIMLSSCPRLASARLLLIIRKVLFLFLGLLESGGRWSSPSHHHHNHHHHAGWALDGDNNTYMPCLYMNTPMYYCSTVGYYVFNNAMSYSAYYIRHTFIQHIQRMYYTSHISMISTQSSTIYYLPLEQGIIHVPVRHTSNIL